VFGRICLERYELRVSVWREKERERVVASMFFNLERALNLTTYRASKGRY